MWWHESGDHERLICDLCPRHCALKPGERGFCFVRENRDGRVVSTTYGRSTGFCIDPIEKKPLHQFYPGTPVLSFGTPGCNLGCTFCQNWTMSRSRDVEAACEKAEPEAIAAAARKYNCTSVAFTYNDPIIWAEYAIDTARACHALGIKTVAVTSGYITETARAAFYEPMDAANVDLKGFTDQFYREYCGGRLQPVLDTLRWLAHESQVWVEITNLIIPGANDSPDDIRAHVPMDRRGVGAGRAAALLGVPSRFQADRPRADAAGHAPDGLRAGPRGRAAIRLHRQRLRPRAAAHVLPRLRPGGDPPRRLHARRRSRSAAAAACTVRRRSPADSTTRRARGADGGCRSGLQIENSSNLELMATRIRRRNWLRVKRMSMQRRRSWTVLPLNRRKHPAPPCGRN